MKIYITGSVGSGKSTLARQISQITGIPCHGLDELVHIPDPAAQSWNSYRPIEERDAMFTEILSQNDYIIEDVGRGCFLEGMRRADAVILLDMPPLVRRKRIVLRWIRQRLGIERCAYRPSFEMLKAMFKWAKNYDTGADELKYRVEMFHEKAIILRSNREIKRYLERIKNAVST